MILVTGAAGYIGQHLVARLVAQGKRPRCLVRDMKKAATILPGDKVELMQGDTTQPATLDAAVRGIDTIVHGAFITADRKAHGSNYYEATNVGGTANLLKAAQAGGVQRVVEIGGLGTKPDKPGSYMQGRYQAEQMLINSGLAWTIIRPSVLFGKDAPFIKGLVELIQSAPLVPLIGGGKILFQPIYVEDVASVIINVLENPERTKNKIYTIGGPEYYSFTQVIDELLQATHKKRPKIPAPLPLVGIGAAVMEAILPKPPLTKAAMALFSFDNITDLNAVERDFAIQPLSFHTYLTTHGV